MWKHKSTKLIENVLGSRVALGASRIMGRLADTKVPAAVLRPAVRLYSAAMKVDASACVEPEDGFSTFNEFFGRTLKDNAREICREKDALTSPCDGRLCAFGSLDESGVEFTIKKSRYTLASLLGSEADANLFKNGDFAVIYLHPRDYHRVHAPFDLRLTETRHIPGTRYPVTAWCEALVDNIYDKNERMVFSADLENGGKAALVMVAALGVGNIETPFDPASDKRQRTATDRCFNPPVRVEKGAELGAFLLGSTVVLIGSQGAFSLAEGLEAGPIELGARIGSVHASAK
jgi:phosphatidylserine decarboxylase